MDTAETFSSSISMSSKDGSNPVSNVETLSIKEECTDDVVSVSYNIIPAVELKPTINPITSTELVTEIPKTYTVVQYGPINVRVKLTESPTLKTGRRSRFTPLEGDAAKKREIRREKNRRLARKLKEKRINIENQLLREITELESNEKELSQEVENLESYKEFLEKRCQQMISSTEETTETNSVKTECLE